MKAIQLLGIWCTLLWAIACGSAVPSIESMEGAGGGADVVVAGGESGVAAIVYDAGAGGEAGAATSVGDAGAGGEAGAVALPPPPPPKPVRWTIRGQSNGVGQAVLPTPWLGDSRVVYFLNGVATQFGPVNGLHGMELGLGPLGADATGLPVEINKSAINGQLCSTLVSGAPEAASLAGIKALSGPDTDKNFAWLQGEADASGTVPVTREAHAACLQFEIAQERAAWGADLHAHILLLNANLAGFNSITQTGLDNVRNAERDVVASDGNADLVEADDLVPALQRLHFDSPQFFELARRFEAKRAASH